MSPERDRQVQLKLRSALAGGEERDGTCEQPDRCRAVGGSPRPQPCFAEPFAGGRGELVRVFAELAA